MKKLTNKNYEQMLFDLAGAAAYALKWRDHDRHCHLFETDFCTCGSSAAVREYNKIWTEIRKKINK